jgi:hypothetical protein
VAVLFSGGLAGGGVGAGGSRLSAVQRTPCGRYSLVTGDMKPVNEPFGPAWRHACTEQICGNRVSGAAIGDFGPFPARGRLAMLIAGRFLHGHRGMNRFDYAVPVSLHLGEGNGVLHFPASAGKAGDHGQMNTRSESLAIRTKRFLPVRVP